MHVCTAADAYAVSLRGLAATPAHRVSNPNPTSRAINTPIKFAIDVPVTNNPVALSGNPKIVRIHWTICRSTSIGI
jgi:hypothetical protein